MSNDTTTLTGALRELGETMAANLTTQGVASTYDEGLTTLAGKILDIQGGGGGTVSSVSLTGSSAILSYADSDTLTLTATALDSNNAGVSGQTIEFFNGSTSMGTATTDGNGQATKTYTSAGVGDVSFTAECGSISSETYAVEDCLVYYPGETTNTSNTYSTQITPEIEYLTNFQVECDFKSTASTHSRLWIVNGSLDDTVSSVSSSNYLLGEGFTGGSKINAYISTGSSEQYGTASSFTVSTNTNYHFTLVKEGTTGTVSYDGTTSWSGTVNSKSWSTFRIGLMSASGSTTITVTDLKVKAL